MSDLLLQLYHRMPSQLRAVPATMRGLYLQRWRYGPESERLVEEARERERWSPARWKAWQEERLAFVLHRAATKVPYYREAWSRRRQSGDRASWELLRNWPVVEKDALRRTPAAFVAEDCDPRRMFHEHTSGTTGTPLNLWWSRQTVREFYALFEARWRRWYGVSRADRWAILGGQLVVPVAQRRPPFWVWNAAMHQLYLSCYHLAPDLASHYLEALRRHRVTYLWGYTSALHVLADAALRLGVRDLKMTVAITNAEPLGDHQREVIGEAFQCPVRETYSMAEIVIAAGECEHGRLHAWPEVGTFEIVERSGAPVADGDAGDLVSTSLLNADMPLIRYRTGDRATSEPVGPVCPCARTLPRLRSVEGRMDDTVLTVDGRRIGRLDTVFKGHLPIREAQIVQETLTRIRVKVVPVGGFEARDSADIRRRLQDRVGQGMEVVVETVDRVPRTAAGKLRPVISLLPQAAGPHGEPASPLFQQTARR